MKPIDVALRFVERINAADLEGMGALMSPRHRLVDSLGDEIAGREKVLKAWKWYFRMVPEYRIDMSERFSRGPVVVLLGTARGAIPRRGKSSAGAGWSTPAVWRARIIGGQVAVWSVYADNEPIRRLMAAGSA